MFICLSIYLSVCLSVYKSTCPLVFWKYHSLVLIIRNTITVGIFYGLPAFQLILSEQLVSYKSRDETELIINS